MFVLMVYGQYFPVELHWKAKRKNEILFLKDNNTGIYPPNVKSYSVFR